MHRIGVDQFHVRRDHIGLAAQDQMARSFVGTEDFLHRRKASTYGCFLFDQKATDLWRNLVKFSVDGCANGATMRLPTRSAAQMKILKVEVHQRRQPKYHDRRDVTRYNAAPRIYVSIEGENILDNLQNRTSRPSRLYAEAVAPALAALGLADTCKGSWSQYAGCTCPCSPGFVVKAKPGNYVSHMPKDVWVTVTGDDAAVDPKKPIRNIFGTSQKPTNTAELISSLGG
jgi:hypothetical protein